MRNMLIYEIRYSGSRAVGLDDEAAHALTGLLMLMESGVAEAAVSLHFFEAAMNDPEPFRVPNAEEWNRESESRRSAAAKLMAELPSAQTREERWNAEQRVHEEASQEVHREAWRRGEWPRSYKHAVPFVYAKAFLYSVDSVAQALGTLAKEPWAPATISSIATAWEHRFPTIRQVRNTSQHQDERLLGRRQGNKKIALQPIVSGPIHAPGGGVTVLNNLNGNRFGCTMSDGHFGEIEVSQSTLVAVGSLTQQSIDAFTWEGVGRYAPH